MAQYGKLEYWEERYSREVEPFDWYQRWTGVRQVFCEHISPSDYILHLGCGNSKMAEDMYEDGFLNSVNIDISQTVIKTMQERYQNIETMRFVHMDALRMEFKDSTFDVAVDKGTLDSVLCSENSTGNSQRYLSEVFRVLNSNGVFLIVSYGQPSQRVPYLNKNEFNWNVSVVEIQKPSIPTSTSGTDDSKEGLSVHYIYICRKGKI